MWRGILAGATALTVLAAPVAAEAAKKNYRAEMRRTTGGWAHVKADNYGSLGFGYGYAYAQDQLCELADIVVTVNAQRSRYFGPQDGNLESDFFYQRIKDMRHGAEAGPPPRAARPVEGRARHGQGLRRRLQRLPAPHRARRPARSHVPRQALGAPDHGARHVPALLPARPARQLGQLPQRDRGRRAAERRRERRPRVDPQAFNRRLGAGRASAPTASASAATAPTASARCCSATRTSRGRAPSAGTRST